MLQFPGFDPIAFKLGPLKVRWYGIMYLIGFGCAWFLAPRRAARPGSTWKPNDVDDLIFFCLLGVLVALSLFARLRRRKIADVFDFTAPLPGLGIFFGRIGNFINGELWGKPTTVPWGFNYDGQVLHPSQLYEACLEGLVLFLAVWWFTRRPRPRLAPS